MIQVKTFIMTDGNILHRHRFEKLDKKVNKFIAENNIEVVNIKYSTSLSDQSALMSAMVIFKTDKPFEE